MIKHLAIIMDGNRRWARAHNLPEIAGHKQVADQILEPLVEHAAQKGIKYLTFWAWSTENWQRNSKEVSGIMRIFKSVIARRWQKLHEKGVRVKVIGDISKFEPSIRQSLEKVVEQTKNNTTITVIFALNYGGRDEIIRAMNKCIKYQVSSIKTENMTPDTLTHDTFKKFLDTQGIPDPEMIIRTGGEKRLSGFMMWQSEYSELFFPEFFMPDFTPERLDQLIEEYHSRQRRFGR